MADEQYEDVRIVGRHLPDSSMEVQPDGSKVAVSLPGLYQIGVLFGEHFQPIYTFKASDYPVGQNAPRQGEESQA